MHKELQNRTKFFFAQILNCFREKTQTSSCISCGSRKLKSKNHFNKNSCWKFLRKPSPLRNFMQVVLPDKADAPSSWSEVWSWCIWRGWWVEWIQVCLTGHKSKVGRHSPFHTPTLHVSKGEFAQPVRTIRNIETQSPTVTYNTWFASGRTWDGQNAGKKKKKRV